MMTKASKIGVIIQARMGARRLPGKMMKSIGRRPAVAHVVERVKRIPAVKSIILATTDSRKDNILAVFGKRAKIEVFRGSENDVLDRYYQAAKLFRVDPVLRITADCPFLDPLVVKEVIDVYLRGDYDYVSNDHPPYLPDGFDVEICSFSALEKIWRSAKLPLEREHVFPYIFNHPKDFRTFNVEYKEDFSHLRLTLDEPADLKLLRLVYRKLHSRNPRFGLTEIKQLFAREPELALLNKDVRALPVSRWQK